MNNYANYIYSNNENETAGLTQEQIEAMAQEQAAQIIAEEQTARKKQALRKVPFIQRRIATRRAANLAARLAQRKAASIGIEKARAEQTYGAREQNINVFPLNQEFLQELSETEPETAVAMIQSHEDTVAAAKQQAIQQFAEALLEDLRTNTNSSAANFIKQIPSIPKSARAAFIILVKLDDLYGKIKRNLAIASTNATRQQFASKQYDIEELRRKVRKVMDKQSSDPTYPFPPGLMREVTAAIAGEDVTGLLAPTLPAANRLEPAFTAYNTAKNARYQALKGQMNTANSKTREKLALLAGIEEVIETIQAQPVQTNAQQQTIQTELDKMEGLKAKLESAIAGNTPLELLDKAKIIGAITSYAITNKSNSIYKKLEANRGTFNERNNAKEAAAAAVAQQGQVLGSTTAAATTSSTVLSPAERRRLAAEAAMKRFQKPSQGGRKTRKARKNRKN
jgi:hypothetical protein